MANKGYVTVYENKDGDTLTHSNETEHEAHIFVNDLIMRKGVRYDKVKVYRMSLLYTMEITTAFIIDKYKIMRKEVRK